MKDTRVTRATEPEAEGGARKAYRKPELIRYGALRELTTGGTSTANENDCGPGEPGCNPDNNKRRP